MQVYLDTLGCRLNEAEIESWGVSFNTLGHTLVTSAAHADLVVLNTCAVTAEAVRKSRKAIQRLKRENPLARLVVTGCHVSLDAGAATDHGIDLAITNHNKDALVQQCHQQFATQYPADSSSHSPAHSLFERHRQRAFIKIQDGCRYRCTFCIVTVARGQERSRTSTEIINEINQLVSAGIQEIVLTGVHVGGYGSDLGTDLYALVQQILRETDVPRIRFASVEPWDLHDNFFTLFDNPRLMPHMHLPLQSGSDTVLKRMARRCKTRDFADLLRTIRAGIPQFNITTDIIVGFPGETENEWRETLEFVAAQHFGHIHVFSYSRREGTKAARLPDQVHGQIKRRRSRELRELAAVSREQIMRQQLNFGKTVSVLWESDSESPVAGRRRFLGYTPNYLRVQTDVDATVTLENRLTESVLSGWDPAEQRLACESHEPRSLPATTGNLQRTIKIHAV